MTTQIFRFSPLHNNNVGHSEICAWTGAQALAAPCIVYKPCMAYGSPMWLLMSPQMSFFSCYWETDLNEAESESYDNFNSITSGWYGCQLFSVTRVDCTSNHNVPDRQAGRHIDTWGRLLSQRTRLVLLKLRSHYYISHQRGISWSFNMNVCTCIWTTVCKCVMCVCVHKLI